MITKKINKEQAIGWCISILGVCIFVIVIVMCESRATKMFEGQEVLAKVKKDMFDGKELIKQVEDRYKRNLLVEEEDVAKAVDEIIQEGKKLNINFTSIRLEENEELKRGKKSRKKVLYQTQTIFLEVLCQYKSFGLFLKNLRGLEHGFVAVKGFNIVRDEEQSPQVRIKLTMDVFLKDK
jgi:hypothetical protein